MYGAYYFWPGAYAPGWQKILAGGFALMAALQAVSAFSTAWGYYREFTLYLRSISGGSSHGTAGFLSEKEARRIGLHKRRTGSRFVGVLGKTALWLYTETHTLILGPAGSAKSSTAFMNALASNSESCIVVDIKREFRETTSELRRKKFQHRIITLDVSSDETDFLNPLDYIFLFLQKNSPVALSLAWGLIMQLYPEPPEEGQNKFFREGTRIEVYTIVLAVTAVCPPEYRNLSTVYRAVKNENFLNELLIQAGGCTLLEGEIAHLADDLHRMAFGDDSSAKTHEQFRIGAVQALSAFGPGNFLAKITSKTTFSFADLKKEGVTVYITVDFSNKDVLGKWAGLMLWIATEQLVRENNNTPVAIYHDECCNSPLFNLPTVLTLLRSYGVKYVAATQDLDDFVRVYGKHALETILSETDIKQFLGGIRSLTTLEFLSKYLGDMTVDTASYAFEDEGTVKESISRTGRALQTTDEIRRLRSDAQIILYANYKPIVGRKVQVFAAEPWRREIAPNSMYGGERYLKPVEVIVDDKGAKVTKKGAFPLTASRRWPLIAEYLLARIPVSAMLIITALITAMFVTGFPHLRWEYRFTGSYSRPGPKSDCKYVGLERFTLSGLNCPFIVFRKIW
ncbi:MAG: type IV secretory system conjugative DNA transfer family protein [Roseibium sp.]